MSCQVESFPTWRPGVRETGSPAYGTFLMLSLCAAVLLAAQGASAANSGHRQGQGQPPGASLEDAGILADQNNGTVTSRAPEVSSDSCLNES